MVNMATPQGRAAQQFMEHKGLGHLTPFDVEKLKDVPCWYFYYRLAEGMLELEVSWQEQTGWQVIVTTFTLAS